MSFTIYGSTYEALADLRERITDLYAAYPGQRFPDRGRGEWHALNEELEAGELRARDQRVS